MCCKLHSYKEAFIIISLLVEVKHLRQVSNTFSSQHSTLQTFLVFIIFYYWWDILFNLYKNKNHEKQNKKFKWCCDNRKFGLMSGRIVDTFWCKSLFFSFSNLDNCNITYFFFRLWTRSHCCESFFHIVKTGQARQDTSRK